MSRKIIHCDCDCFYAAVEMREVPSYRHRPIAIGHASEFPRNHPNIHFSHWVCACVCVVSVLQGARERQGDVDGRAQVGEREDKIQAGAFLACHLLASIPHRPSS